MYIKSKPIKKLTAVMAVISLTACSGGNSNNNSGGGNNSDLDNNVQSIAKISDTLYSNFLPTCIYKHGDAVYIVNMDGSGTGYNLNIVTGQVNSANGLPKISKRNGDICLQNYQQLTWVNNNHTVVNIYDPELNKTVTADLGGAVSGSDVYSSAFNLYGNTLYANNHFDGKFGISTFDLPNPTSYSKLDNSLFSNLNISTILYGFNGKGSKFTQLLQADGAIPASLAMIDANGNQEIAIITDNSSQAIGNMVTAWDITYSNNNTIYITTGGVQPKIYKCSLAYPFIYHCGNGFSAEEFLHKYRVMRLLGANDGIVYYMGINMLKQSIEIFKFKL